jgi:hypothetical protein
MYVPIRSPTEGDQVSTVIGRPRQPIEPAGTASLSAEIIYPAAHVTGLHSDLHFGGQVKADINPAYASGTAFDSRAH